MVPYCWNLILLRDRAPLVRIDVLRRDLLRAVFVFPQPVLVPGEVRLLSEHQDLERGIELREYVPALVGQAELLGLCQVPPLVLALADVVHRDENAQRDEHTERRQRAIPGLALTERADDVPPLAGGVGQQADEPGPRAVHRVLLLGRHAEADTDGHEDQRRAQPPDRSNDSIRH